ncbi:MAG: phage portal protein [Phycisphaerae bacterium]|jgi:hypothetical protein
MSFELEIFSAEENAAQLDADFVEWLIDERSEENHRKYNKLWQYYANSTMETDCLSGADRRASESGRCYIQAQEFGLPARITGLARSVKAGLFGGVPVKDVQRKEVVIENDIGWRINAAVDFLFGKMISFASKAADAQRRTEIESLIKGMVAANGGIGFFQDMAVLGSVYGFVDCIVRPGEQLLTHISNPSKALSFEDALRAAKAIELELIEAPRALPVLDETNYRQILYYVQHFYQNKNAVSRRSSFLSRLLSPNRRGAAARDSVEVTEITSPNAWQRYEDRRLVAEGNMPWDFLPMVHIQNIAQPYFYEGISDVEHLIPLQDELNTRLSDRANRITFQSFKMYLGKGIDGFENRPVAPGRMWCTDNPDAAIEEFGGDAATPSEDLHIAEIREAMDKISGVTPVVAGVLKNKLGNLTSAVALRLTLMGMLSKTDRKRFTYGQGISSIVAMALEMLDRTGIYKTAQAEREVEVIFPNPLPDNMTDRLKEAQIKKELGVPAEQVLKELGYELKS